MNGEERVPERDCPMENGPRANRAEESAAGRIDRWKQLLLDLSLRNRLLNFRETGATLQILYPEPAKVEDSLAAGKKFTLLPPDTLPEEPEPDDPGRTAAAEGENPRLAFVAKEFAQRRLYCLNAPDGTALNKSLLKIYRQAQSDLQEGGINTLFLTLGTVKWTPPNENRAFAAPLLLIPMRLNRISVKEGFTLERADDDALLNVTLLEMLRINYGKTIRDLDPDHLPADENGIDVAEIFRIFRRELETLPGWELNDGDVWLGIFSFQKAIMWNDLDKHCGDLLRNRVVDHLVNHPAETFTDGIEEVKAEQIDETFPYTQIMTPLSADSSQLAAVLSAEKGKSFVLHGPPGSGKSQTIANIIAHCLYKGKSVLFVAEKRAALEVVHQRLSKLGLRPFCLELHSNKAGKRQVLDQFAEALEAGRAADRGEWQATARRLETEKEGLNRYVRELHKVYPNGRTPYEAIAYLISHRDGESAFRKCRFEKPALTLDKETADRLAGEIPANLANACALLPESAWKDFKQINTRQIGYAALGETAAAAQRLVPSAEKLREAFRKAAGLFGIGTGAKTLSEITAAAESEKRISRIGRRIPKGFYSASWETDGPRLGRLLDLTVRRGEILEKLRKLGLGRLRAGNFPSLTGRTGGGSGKTRYTLSSRPIPRAESEDPVARLCGDVNAAAGYLAGACRFTARLLGVELPDEIPETAVGNLALLMHEARRTGPDLGTLIGTDWPLFAKHARAAADIADDHVYHARLLERYNRKLVTEEAAAELNRKYREAEHALMIVHGFKRRSLVRRVRRLQRDWKEAGAGYEQLPDILDSMTAYAASAAVIHEAGPLIRKHAPKAWKDGAVDGELLKKYLDTGEKAVGYARKAFGEQYETALANLAARIGELCDSNTEAGRAVDAVFGAIVVGYDRPLLELARLAADDANFDEATLAEPAFREKAAPDGQAVPIRDLIEALGHYTEVHRLWLDAAEETARMTLPRLESGLLDIETLKSYKEAADEAEAALRAVPESLAGKDLAPLRDRLGAVLARAEGAAAPEEFGRAGAELAAAAEEFRAPRDELAARLEPEPGGRYDDVTQETAAALAERIKSDPGSFEQWCNWNRAAAEAREAGFSGVPELIAEGELPAERVGDACAYALNARMADEALSQVPALGEFLAGNHERLREEFREHDAKYGELARKLIAGELGARMKERISEPGADRELGLLKREIEKKMRHKPIRTLLDSMPNLLTALKPCLLMSPISAAQYLPTSREKFDLVVFDEASQIPTCDAVGAIARGKQLIVVGDPKQLPPTSFFQRARDEETDEEADVEELESILDECLTARLHQIHLRWHYRSRHESLIAFSNRHYYDGGLYTFPTAKNGDRNLGVQFRHVEGGVYDRSKTRTNETEARALVRDAVERMRSPEFRGKSLGIVTFSEAQKGIIEDMLEEERQAHPEIDPFFSPEYPEPVFVKNLENVQGDERDVMYFSIGYGPDRDGKVSMNFGPVNRAGGERRLNVAVTRAKEANIVFSSMTAADIDLGRIGGNTLGPQHLKAYLEYAQKGAESLAGGGGEKDGGENAGFAREVAGVLRRAGYRVRENLGLSRYKIDLAVEDPDRPGEFVLGIECDGPSYAGAATARDRDILRQSVLAGLHWTMLRVWSVQWFRARKNAEETLLAQVAAVFGGRR